MSKCVFSGTFDPPTIGHEQMVESCLKIFDEVVVAVMINPDKTPLLTVDERCVLLGKMYEGNSRVKVIAFNGAAVDLLEQENTPFYVRGLRNTVDFEFENQNHFASKKLKQDLVTIYLPAEQETLQVSSSLVRNSIRFKKRYLDYIPGAIKEDLQKILKNKRIWS